MQEAARQQVPPRGRCANHAAVPSVGSCDRCGRPLCGGCAIPVRGRLIGPECLGDVVDAPVPPPRIVPAIPPSGDLLALGGFSLALLATLLRWSRFGGSRGYLGAWTPHWALLVGVSALLGTGIVLIVRLRPVDPRVSIALTTVLSLVGAFAALVHYRNPPLLAESTSAPVIAMVGFALALAGAVRKAGALVWARRTIL